MCGARMRQHNLHEHLLSWHLLAALTDPRWHHVYVKLPFFAALLASWCLRIGMFIFMFLHKTQQTKNDIGQLHVIHNRFNSRPDLNESGTMYSYAFRVHRYYTLVIYY